MSHTEFHSGRVKEYILKEQTLEDFCKEKCEDNELGSYENWVEKYKNESYEYKPGTFIVVGDKIYEILDHLSTGDDEDDVTLIKNDDGSISFMCSFYNGGTCFSEIIEEELEKL